MSRSRDFGSAAGSLAAPSSTYNGYTHVVDTTQSSGWNYIPPVYAGKNFLINGAMEIWSRGVGPFSTGNNLTADCWKVDNGTATRQSGINQFTYSLQIANSLTNPAIRQGVELPIVGNASFFQPGSTWTISFWAKTSTSISSTIAFYAAFADQNGAGASNAVTIISNSNIGNSSTSWTKYVYTFTVGAGVVPVGTNTCVQIVPYLNSGAYSGNFNITGLQLELSSTATPFSRAGGSFAGEVKECQRFYYRDTLEKHLCYVRDTNSWFVTKEFPVRMRAVPVFNHNLTTKVTPGTFPATAGQIAIYGNGWITQNATSLTAASDGATTDHGTFYIQGFNGTAGATGSLQSNGLSYFEWSADL